jgi:hypothetical protein
MFVRSRWIAAFAPGFLLASAIPHIRGGGPVPKAGRDTAEPAAVSMPVLVGRKSLFQSEPKDSAVAQWVQDGEKHLRQHGEPVLPPFIPVVKTITGKDPRTRKTESVPLLMYRSYWGVHAVSMQTGELEWESPSKWSLEGMATGLIDRRRFIHELKSGKLPYGNRADIRPSVTFENSAVGTLQADEEFLYAIEDLQVPPTQPAALDLASRFPGANGSYLTAGNYSPEITDIIRHNRLQAYQVSTGKLKWEVGDPDFNKELSDYVFHGPPVSRGGKVYLLGMRSIQIPVAARLVCPALAARKFEGLCWQTTLLCLDPARQGRMDFNRDLITRLETIYPMERRTRAARLFVAGDTLVCPTDWGVVVGIDLATGKRTWEYSYRDEADRPVVPRKALTNPGPAPWWTTTPWWNDSSASVDGDRVVFTAADSRSLHCIDLRDGKPRWKVKLAPDDVYLAGVVGDTVVVVSKKSVRGLRLSSGADVWKFATVLPAGRGAARDGLYYLPLQADDAGKAAEIKVLDVAAGRVAARFAFPDGKAPGNLIFSGDQLISQTIRDITVYPAPEVQSRR